MFVRLYYLTFLEYVAFIKTENLQSTWSNTTNHLCTGFLKLFKTVKKSLNKIIHLIIGILIYHQTVLYP